MNPGTHSDRAERAYVAVDLGASSGRVVVGALQSGIWEFAEVHRFENGVERAGDREVWDLERLFAETVTGLRLAAQHCALRGRTICGIGVDSWGVDWATLDSDGTMLLPASSYRGAPDPAPVIAARPISDREVYETSGLPDHAINTGLRLAAQVPPTGAARQTLLFVPDVWVHWLTGAIGTDPTIASTSQLLDVRSREFSDRLTAAYCPAGPAMPPVHPVGSIAGELLPRWREAIGVDYEIPVFRVAGHDTACAFSFADPALDTTAETLVSSGTWSLIGAAASQPVTSPEAQAAGFLNELGAQGVMLIRNLTGLWMLQECLREWNATDELAELLRSVDELEFDPRTFDAAAPELLGAGNMEGRVREMCARAGRPLDESRISIVHAIIDSLAVTYAAGVEAVEQLTGRSTERIRIVGGGSRNARLCHLTAKLSGKTVIAGPIEATAIGNIAIQAAADGFVGHPAQVFAALGEDETRTYEPDAYEPPHEESRP